MPNGYPARASMRPNCPAPTMPTCREFQGWRGSGLLSTAAVCAERKRRVRAALRWFRSQESRPRTERHFGARRADGEGGHGDAARHLRDRQQRIEAAQGLGLHRYAQHRDGRLGGRHPGQVSCPARTGDDGLEPALARDGGVLEQQVRRAVRRDDFHLVRNDRRVERIGRACIVSQSDDEPMMMPTPAFMP